MASAKPGEATRVRSRYLPTEALLPDRTNGGSTTLVVRQVDGQWKTHLSLIDSKPDDGKPKA